MGRLAARLAVCALVVFAGIGSAIAAGGDRATARTASTVSTVTSTASAVLALSGHGYGHGLGLSQWGAYGYALHGFDATQILAHYYPDTTPATTPGRTVRVLVARRRRVALASVSPWRVVDANGTTVQLAAGTITVGPTFTVQGTTLVPPLVFRAAAPIQVAGVVYRGRISVSSDGKALLAVDTVSLESYLQSVVPTEMPSDWPAAALQAQAIAARSYTLANLNPGRSFDLYGDTRDQAYGGVDAESAATTAAVLETKGKILDYGGRVADTLYFSTSGGRTASSAETGLHAPVPYLVSVRDPYDATSPYHDWGPVVFTLAGAARRLGVATPIVDVAIDAGPSGRAETVTFTAGNGGTTGLSGEQVRSALALRSTWFATSLLELDGRTASLAYGSTMTLSGRVRAIGTVSLEAKSAGGDWSAVGAVTPGSDGTFSAVVTPRLRTSYRLALSNLRAGLVTVAVSARCDAAIGSAGAQGTVAPAVAGTAIQLQRTDGQSWTAVGTATAAADGAFTFTGPLAPGAYRVRCAPGGGVSPGLSSEVTLP